MSTKKGPTLAEFRQMSGAARVQLYRSDPELYTKLDAEQVSAAIAALLDTTRRTPDTVQLTVPIRLSPVAELWLMPPETRLNVTQAAAAVGRTKSFIYHHTTLKNATC